MCLCAQKAFVTVDGGNLRLLSRCWQVSFVLLEGHNYIGGEKKLVETTLCCCATRAREPIDLIILSVSWVEEDQFRSRLIDMTVEDTAGMESPHSSTLFSQDEIEIRLV